jgi:hypothetical protein
MHYPSIDFVVWYRCPRISLLAILAFVVSMWAGCNHNPDENGMEKSSDRGGDDSETALDAGLDTTSETEADSESDTNREIVDLGIVINEIMSKNDGVVLDEASETEDWVELLNRGGEVVDLSDFTLSDSNAVSPLPPILVNPGEVVLFFADDDTAQGERHLSFKLSSSGDTLSLKHTDGRLGDFVALPMLSPNESLARLPDGGAGFEVCRYATPGKTNGEGCTPSPPREMETVHFAPFDWPSPYPPRQNGLVINELSLRPASFIEIINVGDETEHLADFTLAISGHKPGIPLPLIDEGTRIPLLDISLTPGERTVVAVDASHVEEVADDPLFEGVVTLFETETGTAVDRVDFMSWPEGAHLVRIPDGEGVYRFCTNATDGEKNQCDVLPSRTVGDRLRYLRCPADFDALAEGGAKVGIGSVKFVVDLEGGDTVHLLGSKQWPLHYTFVREVIDGNTPLDRCDPVQNTEFRVGWHDFSVANYYTVEGRRYLLGTLSHHGGAGIKCVEYTFGDAISPAQMVYGFFTTIQHLVEPETWVLRPQDDDQLDKVREVEGSVPLVGPNAPFADVTFQPLTEGVGYGYLTFLDADELATASLGPDKIVVLGDVPNDIPFVGGVITEAFQTPLSHVNILSRSRNTPNMALVNAKRDAQVAPYEGVLVKLEVLPTHFEITEADPVEAEAYWDKLRPEGPLRTLPQDLSMRGVVPLDETMGFEHRSAVGVKAAQLSELDRIVSEKSYCTGTIPLVTPANAFAIPVAHYLDHFDESGAREMYASIESDSAFLTDPVVRGEQLAALRQKIMSHPVDDALLEEVAAEVESRFGKRRVRFRSSSNAEDLADFNGAGLYTSISGQIGNSDRSIEDAMRTVWAGLWNQRAFDERTYANIDHNSALMGILVHEAFLSEKANGVAVSRNILEPNRGDKYYVNVQAGEATVTNPAPGVSTEQLIYQWPSRTPTLNITSTSSLIDGPVLLNEPVTDPFLIAAYGEVLGETRDLVCALSSVHDHFETLLDPAEENPWFAMEIEFKLITDDRIIMVKQARPYAFGDVDMPADCREL